MAIGGWGVSDYLEAAALWPGQPFGVSLWFYVPTGTDPTGTYLYMLGNDDSEFHWRAISFHGSGGMSFLMRDTGTVGAVTTAGYAFDAWQNVTLMDVSSTLREITLNGGNKGTNTTSKTVNAPNHTLIGRREDTGSPDPIPAAVGVGSFSVWDLSGFSTQDRDDWAAECASGANPNDMDADTGQQWEGRLVPNSYASLLNLSSPGAFTEVGSLSVFASHPPVAGEAAANLPGAPSLNANARSWDAMHLVATAGADTDEIRIYRDTSVPDPQTSPLVATLTPDGVAFDTGLTPDTLYFYLPVASNSEGDTEGSGEIETTWPDTAIETFEDQDDIVIPFDILSGERATELRFKAGTAIRSVAALGSTGGINVEVRDAGNQLIGDETFPSLSNTPGDSLSDLVVPLDPAPIGPQTLSVTFTASIS